MGSPSSFRRTAPTLTWGAAAVCAVLAWSACGDEQEDVLPSGAGGALAVVASSSIMGSSTFASAGSTGGAPPSFGCNPVTNEGCDVGEVCDTQYADHAFVCYPIDGALDRCAPCGPSKGYCRQGLTCFEGLCQKFCCADVDCSLDARCDKELLLEFGMGQVGLCRVDSGRSSGVGGAGGAGGAAQPASPEPDCAAPEPSESEGDCVPPAPT